MNKINGLRFIIGTKCNFNCFYCHHEGCVKSDNTFDPCNYEIKIKLLQELCVKQNIHEIAITGGEPFLYIDKLRIILKHFTSPDFHVIINTNASLLDKYIDFLNLLPSKLEFHVNFSSLTPITHKRITQKNLLSEIKNSLASLSNTKHTIKLNIICLKSINDNELIEIDKFARLNGYTPRYLILYDKNNSYSHFIMSSEDVCAVFNAIVYEECGYGIIKAKGEFEIEIVKCLCIDKECVKCKQNTYLHIDPELNIKYCLDNENSVTINYDSYRTMINSFHEACAKLERI